MSENTAVDMRQLIQSQQEAIANDPTYPLNDFKNHMRVGGIPTGKERAQLEHEILSVAEQFHNVPSTATVLDEKDKVSPAIAQRSLDRQRRIVEQLRKNAGTAQPRRSPQSPRPPEDQEEARLRANRVMQDIVTREEQELIDQCIKSGELGYIEGLRKRKPEVPLEFDDPNDVENMTGISMSSESTNTGSFDLPNEPFEDEFEDE